MESGILTGGLPDVNRIVSSLFLSVNPRTSGFTTVDLNRLSEGSIFLIIVLMFIGGSPGSTSGGIKTTTFAILLLNSLNSFRKKHSMVVFKKKLDERTAKRASAIVTMYMIAIFIATILLSAIEPYSLKEIIFEVVSAIGTVGLSLGITTELSLVGKIIIITLMITGRVGLITLLLALSKKRIEPPIERPVEKVLIG